VRELDSQPNKQPRQAEAASVKKSWKSPTSLRKSLWSPHTPSTIATAVDDTADAASTVGYHRHRIAAAAERRLGTAGPASTTAGSPTASVSAAVRVRVRGVKQHDTDQEAWAQHGIDPNTREHARHQTAVAKPLLLSPHGTVPVESIAAAAIKSPAMEAIEPPTSETATEPSTPEATTEPSTPETSEPSTPETSELVVEEVILHADLGHTETELQQPMARSPNERTVAGGATTATAAGMKAVRWVTQFSGDVLSLSPRLAA
jgi:hypothetical protein